jgi:hypothetical protein
MATFKCPGCNERFGSSRALGTHKTYCQTKITAVASKLLERRRLNAERRGTEPEVLEEELEIEGDDVPAAEIPCPTPVSCNISTVSSLLSLLWRG